MNHRAQLLDWIEQDKDRLIDFLRTFTRIDTVNPPGDTRAGAALITKALADASLAFRVVGPREDMPNIIASFEAPTQRRHLVLNGHIDVFPIGERSLWTRDPLSGDHADGRIWGRGTVDMKCGTTASLFAFIYVSRLIRDLSGRLTLTVVSDEETGARFGSEWITENLGDEVLGDCMLNSEPSSIHTLRFGEKALFRLNLRVRTAGAHGAYLHLSRSAIRIAADLIIALAEVEQVRARVPAHVDELLASPDVRAAMDRGLGAGASDYVHRCTLNVGKISGGIAVSIIPSDCLLELDIRLPLGITAKEMRGIVEKIAARFPEVTIEDPPRTPVDPMYSDPDHRMVGILQDTVHSLMGFRPLPIVSLGSTDCRFWRKRNVPTYVYGCSPIGMGRPNESVLVDEFLHVVRTHTLAAYNYLRNA
jgi:succinyl-diaminopimelate desuccinylase